MSRSLSLSLMGLLFAALSLLATVEKHNLVWAVTCICWVICMVGSQIIGAIEDGRPKTVVRHFISNRLRDGA